MISGIDELLSKLQALKKVKAKAAIRKGTRAGSKILQTVAKRLSPSKTGALARAVKVRSIARSRIWVGTKVTLELYYGSFTELGTHKEKAIHFLKRAVKQAGRRALQTALETINDEVMK